MTSPTPADHPRQQELRLWPGVVAAVALLLSRFAGPLLFPDRAMPAVMGAAACALLIVLWWLFFSRAPWIDRLGGLALMVGLGVLTWQFLHPTIASGMMGLMFGMLMCVALVAAAVASRTLPWPRLRTLTSAIAVVCVGFLLIRAGGMTGDADLDIAWRWTPSPEERLLAEEGTIAPTPRVVETAPAPIEWPSFRGPRRDGSILETAIGKDWTAAPPKEVWRRPVGPAWSSFAVRGDLIYTQEQRGEDEVVTCYRASTGEPVWRHRDAARFWEAISGAGPRGTPTVAGDRVYTFGGTGILNALDAVTGEVIWTRQAATDAAAETPTWGFASSPLVLGDLVLVAVSGQLVAYDLASGATRWSGPGRGGSYSSPQLVTLDGVAQILLLSEKGLASLSPTDGKVLWEHAWAGYPIVQPALTPEGDVLISVSDSSGLRRLAIAEEAGAWKVEEKWTSIGLKPYFSDFAVHGGYAYGFDGAILSCIDLADGKRQWKGGRYGQGQLVLLAKQDLLLVLSEHGELVLVSATPDKFTEVAKISAIEGKTWNHPVLVGDLLFVRNGQEMAAFRLATR